jgi:hypothetical protein
MTAATVKGEKARIFTVEDDVAHAADVKLLGERDGVLFLDPALKRGTQVVSDGHTVLEDKDRVTVGGAQ